MNSGEKKKGFRSISPSVGQLCLTLSTTVVQWYRSTVDLSMGQFTFGRSMSQLTAASACANCLPIGYRML